MIFREVQQFRQIWLWILILGMVGMGWYGFIQQILLGKPFGDSPAPDGVIWLLWILLGILFPLFFLSLRLIVEVRPDELFIRFFPFYTRRIPLSEIRDYEAVRYSPLLDYGGWGIRWNSVRGWAYTVSGNQGVQLELVDGKRLLIGSQQPEKLVDAIEKARRGL